MRLAGVDRCVARDTVSTTFGFTTRKYLLPIVHLTPPTPSLR
jgi:hypothetical protein